MQLRLNSLLIIFCTILCWSNAFAQNGLVKVSEHVYAYLDTKGAAPANSFGANAGIIIGKDYLVVVDTLISAKEAKRFLGDIRKVSDLPIKYVINTHFHLDHVFGNSEFTKLGASIIAQEKCYDAMVQKGQDTLDNIAAYGLTTEDMTGTALALPEISFEEKMVLNTGTVSVHIALAASSHTPGSVLVHVPEEKVLFSGDIMFTDFHPYMGDADIKGWNKALMHIATLDANKIIPGHGPLSSRKDAMQLKEYLLLFDKTARKLAASDGTLEEKLAALKAALPKRTELEGIIEGNFKMRYMAAK